MSLGTKILLSRIFAGLPQSSIASNETMFSDKQILWQKRQLIQVSLLIICISGIIVSPLQGLMPSTLITWASVVVEVFPFNKFLFLIKKKISKKCVNFLCANIIINQIKSQLIYVLFRMCLFFLCVCFACLLQIYKLTFVFFLIILS